MGHAKRKRCQREAPTEKSGRTLAVPVLPHCRRARAPPARERPLPLHTANVCSYWEGSVACKPLSVGSPVLPLEESGGTMAVTDQAISVTGRGRVSVLITGASGFVGRFLISELARDSNACFEVHAAYGSDPTFAAEFGDRCATITALDLASGPAVRALLEQTKPDVVVHLAAISAPSTCEAEPDRCMLVNEPHALLDAIAHLLDRQTPGPQPGALACRLILFSSDQVYDGNATAQRFYVETDDVRPVNE